MIINIFYLLVGGLITWRLSNLLIKQVGPLAIFARFRAFLASKQKRAGGFYDMLSCMSCVSMIMGAVTALGLVGLNLEFFAYFLSFSAIATLIDISMNRNIQ